MSWGHMSPRSRPARIVDAGLCREGGNREAGRGDSGWRRDALCGTIGAAFRLQRVPFPGPSGSPGASRTFDFKKPLKRRAVRCCSAFESGERVPYVAAMTDTMFEALRLFLGSEIAEANRRVQQIAGYRVPDGEDRAYVDFIGWVNEGRMFIQTWRSTRETELSKYVRFMNGIEDCRSGYAAASYHLSNLRQMEDALHAALGEFDFSKSFRPGTTAAIGHMERCDFEYQAFVMAYRRSLDTFAWGLSTYFKEQQTSFRKLAEVVRKYHPPAVAQAVSDACERHVDKFAFVMAKERSKSVRDRLAHKEAVRAGSININRFGHRILGGGENIGLPDLKSFPRIADVLASRLADHRDCIADILGAFRAAVEREEAAS